MAKIKSATPLHSYGLLQSVNEAGAWDNIKKTMGFGGDKEQHKGIARKDATSANVSSKINELGAEIMEVPGGESRWVIHLSQTDLQKFYLVGKDGSGFVDQLTPKELSALAANPEDAAGSRLVRIPSDKLSFVEMTKSSGKNNFTVFINVPTSLDEELKKAGDDAEAQKATLKKMMDRKYYLMTVGNRLANAKADNGSGTIAQAIDAAGDDPEALRKAFNPYIIANFPVKQELEAAKDEWEKANPKKGGETAQKPAAEKTGEEGEEGEKQGGDQGGGTEHNGPEEPVAGGGGAGPTTWEEYKKAAPEPKDVGTPYVKPSIPVADAQKVADDFLDKLKADLELFSKDGFAIPASRTEELKSISKLLSSFNEGKLSFLDRGTFLTEMKMKSRRRMFGK